MVPWCMTRPCLMYWELPENFCPSMVMSLRPLHWASIPWRRSRSSTGWQKAERSSVPESPAPVMKVKLMLPRSWYTAPPPESRRTTRTPWLLM